LQELIRLTNPTHRDFTPLKNAIETLQETAKMMNTKKAEQAQLAAIEAEISPPNAMWSIVSPMRRLIKEGSVQYVGEKLKVQPGHLYLFNDIVLLASKEEKSVFVFGKGKPKKQLVASLSLRFMSVDSSNLEHNIFKVIIVVFGQQKGWHFISDTRDDARSWAEALTHTISAFLQGPKPMLDETTQTPIPSTAPTQPSLSSSPPSPPPIEAKPKGLSSSPGHFRHNSSPNLLVMGSSGMRSPSPISPIKLAEVDEDELVRLREENGKLKEANKTLQDEKEALNARIASLERKVEQLTGRLEAVGEKTVSFQDERLPPHSPGRDKKK